MDTVRERKLARIARHLGVRILPDLRGELHPVDAAGRFPRSQRILYRTVMPYTETLCAVAHELGHAYHGDEYSDDHQRDTRQEARANRWAVRALITSSDYEEVEALVGSHPGVLATGLGVTVEYIHIWRDLHAYT